MNDLIRTEYIKAGSAQTDPEELEMLSRSAYEAVRRRVAENGKTPLKILAILAKDY